MAKPTTHEDLLDTYKTRASEHNCGFLLAGEIAEAGNVVIDGEPALGQNRFRLRHPASLRGYIELDLSSCELPRFGCGVSYYKTVDLRPSYKAIEAAFIELLDGAVAAA